MWFFHVLLAYRTTFHVSLRYIERYVMYSVVYRKAPFKWLCIRQHYYRVELPRTLIILGDSFRDPVTKWENPFGRPIIAIHREQHSRRLLCTYRPGSRVFRQGYSPNPHCHFLLLDPAIYSKLWWFEIYVRIRTFYLTPFTCLLVAYTVKILKERGSLVV